MDTLEPHEDTPHPWQQRGSLPQSVIDELGRTFGTDEAAPAGLFLQQEAFTAWARERGAIIERNSITGRKLGGGVEHEVIEDLERQRVIKITHAGQYGCVGCTRWGKVELVQAKPLEYPTRLAHVIYTG